MSIKVIKPFLFNTNLVFDSKDTIIRNLKTKIVILENRIKQLESLIENKRKLTRANSYTKHQSNNLILTNFKSVKLINPQELLNNIDISPNNNSQSPHKTKMRLQKYRNLSLHNIKHNTNVSSESTSISGVVVNNNNNNNTHNKTRNKFKCEAIPRLPRNIRIVGNNTVNNKNGYLTPSYTDGGSGKKIKGKINCGDNSCDDGKGSVVNERDDGCRSMVKCFTVGNNTPRKKVFSKGKVKGFGKGDLNLNKNWSSHNNNSEGSGKQQYGGVNMQLKCIKERTRKLLTQLISMNYNCKCACK